MVCSRRASQTQRSPIRSQPIYWAIALSVGAVFLIDLQTRIGVATWLLYLVPLVLCFLGHLAFLPFVVATAATLLIVLDWFLSPPAAGLLDNNIALFNRGMGLFVMRERVALVGGTLDVASRPGGGTRVHAIIPLGEGAS